MPDEIRRGDVVLIDGLEQGWVSFSIAVGTVLRYGLSSPYRRWTHVALVYDAPAQASASISIVEATATSGVHQTFLWKYRNQPTAIVHTGVGDRDWGEMKTFLDDVLRARERYDFVTYAGLFFYALTGTSICVQEAGTATCSGLVAEALTRAGFVWSRPPYACTPANIAENLDSAGHPICEAHRAVDG